MDWSELDYTQEENRMVLRRVIAEAQGYTVRTSKALLGTVYDLVAPDGTVVTADRFCAETSDAWEFAPEYPDDLNAAIPLLDEIGEWVDIRWTKLKQGLVYRVFVSLWGEARKKKRRDVYIEHADLCIACCLAYIEWREHQQKIVSLHGDSSR